MENQRAELFEKLRSFRTLMLITVSGGGEVLITPMSVLQYEEPGVFWFATGLSSKKVENISENEREVHLTAQNDGSVYAVAKGMATLHRDETARDRLWSEPLRVWFPDGKGDPDLVFLRIRVIEGEYWDSAGLNKARYVFQAIKAYATGTRPDVAEGPQHGRLCSALLLFGE